MKLAASSFFAAAMMLSAPGLAAGPTSAGIAEASHGRLSAFLACLRQQKTAVVIAHRGGPFAEHPENAIVTFDYTTSMVPSMIETDIQQARDGSLFQNHDTTLERTTTGTGEIADKTSTDLTALKLLDPFGIQTTYSPPRLSEALEWSRRRSVLLLDMKPQTDAEKVATEVRAAGMDASLLALSYTLDQARAIRTALPEAVIVVPAMSPPLMALAKDAGLLGPDSASFVGTGKQGGAVMAHDLEALGVTPIMISYMGPDSPDARYRTIADAPLYQQLVADGARLIISNRPLEAAAALMADPGYAARLRTCGVK